MTDAANYEGETEPHRKRGGSRPLVLLLDKATYVASLGGVLAMLGLLVVLVWILVSNSWPAIMHFGVRFFWSTEWDPVNDKFGALPMIYGTAVSSFIALLMAVPVSLGTAIFITRLAPKWLSGPVSFLVELLAAIPSLAYGLWGALVMVPWLQKYGEPALQMVLQHVKLIPLGKYDSGEMAYFPANLVHGGAYGTDMLAGGLILALMIIPIITAVSRDVLKTVPKDLEQGAYGLGATWWQVTRIALGYSKVGIFGAVILGLARAVGETMAVVMVIGNTNQMSGSLFDGAQTMAGLLANEFLEADNKLYYSSLVYVALILLVSTLFMNALARLMLAKLTAGPRKR
ncbi:MAG: phosphate ABC transporter permease subunit PstC [Phycisphaerae bacterium]